MEEIDIIELLKRVKEGKAPKEIEVDGEKFILKDLEKAPIECLYYKEKDNGYIINWLEDTILFIDTKIKILDKPIIEEIDDTNNVDIFDLARKVNQIIRHINKEEK